jgi:hypothetical protein
MKLSIIISILNSHKIVSKQLTYLQKILSKDKYRKECELIFADDGSKPPLRGTIDSLFKSKFVKEHPSNVLNYDLGFSFRLLVTNDFRFWTQPLARNSMAKISRGDVLLMTDIDHILTEEAIDFSLNNDFDRLLFKRNLGYLDDTGNLVKTPITEDMLKKNHAINTFRSPHLNTFAMKRSIFIDLLGGYTSSTIENYGSDTCDIVNKYNVEFVKGKVTKPLIKGMVYTYSMDNTNLFHSLPRNRRGW